MSVVNQRITLAKYSRCASQLKLLLQLLILRSAFAPFIRHRRRSQRYPSFKHYHLTHCRLVCGQRACLSRTLYRLVSV